MPDLTKEQRKAAKDAAKKGFDVRTTARPADGSTHEEKPKGILESAGAFIAGITAGKKEDPVQETLVEEKPAEAPAVPEVKATEAPKAAKEKPAETKQQSSDEDAWAKYVEDSIANAVDPLKAEIAELKESNEYLVNELTNARQIATEIIASTTESMAVTAVEQAMRETGLGPTLKEIKDMLEATKKGDASDKNALTEVKMHLPLLRAMKAREEEMRRIHAETKAAVNQLLAALGKKPATQTQTPESEVDDGFTS